MLPTFLPGLPPLRGRCSYFAFLCLVLLSSFPLAWGEEPDFASQIKPILANHCWSCHGPDEQARQGDLRLDRQEDAWGSLKVLATDSQPSSLVARIESSDPTEVMPPPESKKTLSTEQRALLTAWVNAGAKYSQHWSFVPPRMIDQGAAEGGSKGEVIDRLVRDRLSKEGLRPSAPARPETLLRRVSLDLTGLPPTIEELNRFLEDKSEDAYEKAVDRLLASDAYAERMAAHWLDLARYADTNGYNNDEDRQMWPWRDWLIRAFRDNMPMDRFIREMLAGDMLPDAKLDQQIATGFLRNQGHNTEGGIIQEEYRIEYVADRVHTAATVFLGLSMQCARCHDHKIDPITQNEYYQFFALFNNLDEKQANYSGFVAAEPYIRVPTAEQIAKKNQLAEQLRGVAGQIQAKEDAIEKTWTTYVQNQSDEAIQKGLSTVRLAHIRFDENTDTAGGGKPWLTDQTVGLWSDPSKLAYSEGKQGRALSLSDGRLLASEQLGRFASDRPFSISVWVHVAEMGTMAVLSRMDEARNYRGYDMLVVNGKIEVHLVDQWPSNAIKISSQQTIKPAQWHHITLTYDGSKQASGLKIYMDGTASKVDVVNNGLKGSLATDKPFHIGLRETTLPYRGLIDELQLFDGELSAGDVAELANLKTPRSPIEWVRRSWPELADEQREQAKRWVRERIDLEHAKLITQRGDLEKEIRAIEQSAPGVMVLKEMVPPRETFVLKRGQYDQPTIKVSAGTPAVLRMEGVPDPKTRLEFADWLTHPKNPLAARVAVNRLWEQCFGVGLVRTSEDFGGSGEYPIHRELLDQLAQEFVRGGWDVRGMLRNIVLSSTYRQDSRLDPEQGAKDPENRLLGRGPRHRLSAEVIRDNAFAISGLLVRKIGGPSVKPYQPPGLWEDVTVERRGKYVADSGEGLYRRSMYTFWKRTCPPPAMVTFDAPNREVCVARRSRTNTPLQALVLLNDPTYVEAARHFASDLVRSSDMDDFAKIQLAYRKALGREASFEEVAPIQSLLVEARRRFSEDQKRLSEFLAVGATPLATDLPATELGAWTVVCSMLLNLDETITKY